MAEFRLLRILGRLVSLEGMLGLAGLALLVAGLATGVAVAIFWGVLALLGLTALYFVRKKDWKAHWEELERLQAARDGKPQPDSDRAAGDP